MSNSSGFIDYKSEILRKSIHLSSISIPVIYYFIPQSTALIILTALVVFAFVVDLTRIYLPSFRSTFNKFFGSLLRQHEIDTNKKSLSGATYVLLSALLCVAIFPKLIVITAFSILIISDTAAALIGRKFGKRPFLRKSLVGTFSFFVSAVIVVLVAPKLQYSPVEYVIGVIGAGVGAIIENIVEGVLDDNLAIPISVGAVMLFLYTVLFPGIKLILPNTPL